MTEREFEQRLRGYYRAEVEGAGRMPTELRENVWRIPDRMPVAAGLFQSRRAIVLLAAAMLTALLVGGAIAIGAGLLRLPWERPPSSSELETGLSAEMLQPIPCDQSLPPGLAMSLQVFQDGPPLHLYVYDDGFVIRGTPGQLADDPQWQQRQMAAEGVQALIGSVVASGLRNCVDVPVSGSQLEFKARTADGVVAVSLGSGSFRVASPAELDAAAELARVLRGEDLGIASEGWADLAWRPYPLERWEVRISRWEGYEEAFGGAVSAPWPDMVLPDGTSPLTFGRQIPVFPGGIFDEERCEVLTREEADAFGAFLDTQQTEGIWSFQDASGGVSFNVNPLLPHRSGCASNAGTSPETPRGNLIEDLDACAYLPEALLADVLPEPWTPFDSQRETHGDGGWASCEYWEAWVYASRHRIGADEARAAVEVQFGVGLVSDSIDGRTVYFNDCLSGDATCSPAIAIAAPPHLVIIVPTDADESMLRALAAALIQSLDQT